MFGEGSSRPVGCTAEGDALANRLSVGRHGMSGDVSSRVVAVVDSVHSSARCPVTLSEHIVAFRVSLRWPAATHRVYRAIDQSWVEVDLLDGRGLPFGPSGSPSLQPCEKRQDPGRSPLLLSLVRKTPCESSQLSPRPTSQPGPHESRKPNVDPQFRGPDWMPITPKGVLFARRFTAGVGVPRSATVSHITVLSLLSHEGSGSGQRCGAIPGKRLFLLSYRHRRVLLQRLEGRVKTRPSPAVPNSGNQVVLNPGNCRGPNS